MVNSLFLYYCPPPLPGQCNKLHFHVTVVYIQSTIFKADSAAEIASMSFPIEVNGNQVFKMSLVDELKHKGQLCKNDAFSAKNKPASKAKQNILYISICRIDISVEVRKTMQIRMGLSTGRKKTGKYSKQKYNSAKIKYFSPKSILMGDDLSTSLVLPSKSPGLNNASLLLGHANSF